MAAVPKDLPGEDPPDEGHLAKQETELEDMLDLLVERLGARKSELLDLIARSPKSSSAAQLARAIVLATSERAEAEATRPVSNLSNTELAEPSSDPDRRAAQLDEMARRQGVRPWTPERLAEYLDGPRNPYDELTDEEFEEWLAEIYRARKSEVIS